ncbi:MAG: tetratricopeptide repeat protein [Verrucomicrobiota bacterium]
MKFWSRQAVHLYFLLGLSGFLLLGEKVFAHGDLHERILVATVAIKQDAKNPELYFQRGELYRQHGEWKLALADFAQAEKLNPKLTAINFARGKAFFESGQFDEAKAALDKFIFSEPNHSEALALRARSFLKLGQSPSAVNDFTRAIDCAKTPSPDYFLQRARAQIAEGKSEEALTGLDEGIQKLGPVASFQLLAIDLEVNAKRYDAALSRLEKSSRQSPRKETWLARRGDILEQAGRRLEAREAFAEALKSLKLLPPSRRDVPAMADLEMHIGAALLRLEKESNQKN